MKFNYIVKSIAFSTLVASTSLFSVPGNDDENCNRNAPTHRISYASMPNQGHVIGHHSAAGNQGHVIGYHSMDSNKTRK